MPVSTGAGAADGGGARTSSLPGPARFAELAARDRLDVMCALITEIADEEEERLEREPSGALRAGQFLPLGPQDRRLKSGMNAMRQGTHGVMSAVPPCVWPDHCLSRTCAPQYLSCDRWHMHKMLP